MSTTDSGPMGIHVARANYATHVIFPARTIIKDVAYWVCEIAAALIFLGFITRFDLQEYNIYKSDDPVLAYSYVKTTSNQDTYAKNDMEFAEGGKSGIPLDFKTHILNNEYGWICLCYAVKHFIYIIDTVVMIRRTYSSAVDIIPPILNCGLWVLWMIYGFTNVGYEIYAGIYERYGRDSLRWEKDHPRVVLGVNVGMSDDEFNKKMANVENWYKDNAKWTWLWVPTIIVCAINFLLWLFGGFRFKSSVFTNVAAATWLIPLQLFFLHLFLKGSWISSNYAYYAQMSRDDKVPKRDDKDNYVSYMLNMDYYEARWVFPIVYIAAWIGLIFAIVCLFRAVLSIRKSCYTSVKNLLYFLFFIACFIWCLALDKILWQRYIQKGIRDLLVAMHIIALVLAFFIGILSILERYRMKDEYIVIHKEYKTWYSDAKYSH